MSHLFITIDTFGKMKNQMPVGGDSSQILFDVSITQLPNPSEDVQDMSYLPSRYYTNHRNIPNLHAL